MNAAANPFPSTLGPFEIRYLDLPRNAVPVRSLRERRLRRAGRITLVAATAVTGFAALIVVMQLALA